MSYLRSFSFLLVCLGLVACGGGGGGSTNTPPSIQQSSSQQFSSLQSSLQQSSEMQSSSSVANLLKPITRQTAPAVAGAVVDTFDLAVSVYFEINEEFNLYSSLADGTQTVKCAKGSARIKISNAGHRIEEHYENCQQDGVEINGDRIIEIMSSAPVTGATIDYSYKKLSVSILNQPLQAASINGLITYTGRAAGYSDSDSNYSTTFNLTIDDARDGRLEIKNFKMEAEYNPYGTSSDFHENMARMKSASGSFVLNDTRFSMESITQGLLLKGDNNSRVSLTRDQNYNAYVSWDETGDGVAEANLALPYAKEFSITDMIADGDHKTTVLVARNYVSQIYEGAQVYMARGNTADVYVHGNFTNSSASLLNYELNGQATNDVDWTQVEAGHFKFSFPSNTVDTNYDLTFTAVDDKGNKSPEIHAKIFVGTDTDKDGIPDASDEDDDNDGSADQHDAFPLDSKEYKDSDGDGIGDNADPDADSAVQGGFVWFVDKDGVVYFTSSTRTDYEDRMQKKYSKRWDPKTNKFLSELVLPHYGGYNSYYSLEQNRLYYVSSNNDVYYVDLATMQEILFAKGGELQRVDIRVKSNIVLVSRTSRITTTFETYSDKGQLISSIDAHYSTSFYPEEVGAFCDSYVTFDTQGKLYNKTGSTSYICSISTIKISLDGRYVYRESGSWGIPGGIYATEGTLLTGLDYIGAMLWLPGGLLARDQDGLVLYNIQGMAIKRYALPEGASIRERVFNNNSLILSLQLAEHTIKIVALNSNFELISQYVPAGRW